MQIGIVTFATLLSFAKAMNSCNLWTRKIARTERQKWNLSGSRPQKKNCLKTYGSSEMTADVFFCSDVCIIPDGFACNPNPGYGRDICGIDSYCDTTERICKALYFDESSFSSSSFDDFFYPDIIQFD
ncbi:Oidioi.mRNA.OKI2018_I69.chr2.g6524.t1.cds [Oikopleura dioica]|uniref:Oidioi.mRNA.OKI2018_I69.chr2.g6524.t1.cds n=1 Tax=Oikopleura dioica TaxID=34765 RepID=A0ABN7T4A0_OIKDI|nr:Oidioi.mRNA.OKI2018_I69.chr2.g6524.t1.cds [Oikopleura dioica]